MFKKLLFLLDPSPDDEVLKRIQEEKVMEKYWLFLGAFFVCFAVSLAFMGLSFLKFKNHREVPVFLVPSDVNAQLIPVDTLPYPQQSFQTISLWLNEALKASYTLDFNDFDNQVENVKYYYSDSGFEAYKMELKNSMIENKIKKGNLMMTVWPTSIPIVVNSRIKGEDATWRIRMDINIAYESGSKQTIEKARAEFVVIRVPPYKNPKSLNISGVFISQV